ncbi:MAG: hypothetical protein ACYC48_02675 [Minisyncoccota bacterium]
MSTKSEFSVIGLAHKLFLVAEEQGYTPELINALAEKPDLLKHLLQVQLGYAEFKQVEHVIDCDVDPFVPNGSTIKVHRKGGLFKWDTARQANVLYLSAKQKIGSHGGNELRKELSDVPVLNACVLDYLLANQHLIPEGWKDKAIFFWGTIYRNSDGDLCVRCLCWDGDGWSWADSWLDSVWNVSDPAALRAS